MFLPEPPHRPRLRQESPTHDPASKRFGFADVLVMSYRFASGVAVAVGLTVSSQVGATLMQFPANGHFYEIIEPGPINWTDARDAAATRGGYLATLTSADENTFVWDLLTDYNAALSRSSPFNRWFWLGGYQPAGSTEPAGGWTWVTGEAWSYTNWSPLVLTSGDCTNGSPAGISAPWNNCQNPARGPADYLHYFQNQPTDAAALWGDVELQIAVGTNRMLGYVVEYDTNPAPIPATAALMAIGLLGLALRRRAAA